MRDLIPTTEIRVETSTRCNFHCLMCPRENLARQPEVMSNELFSDIVGKAKKEISHLRMCTVSGYGELGVDPFWKEKLALARERFEEVHVVTNLSSMRTEEDLSALAACATEVRVSINAVGEERYREVHRPPPWVTYDSVKRSIEILSGLRRPGFSLRLSFSQLDENADQVNEWIAAWQDRVDGLEVWRPHNWVDGKSFRSLAGKRLESCGRPASGPIQVQVDGTVNVCCFDYNGQMVIGDLKTQSYEEIYSGEAMTRIRLLHRTGRADELDLCARCDQRDPPEHRKQYMVYCSWQDAEDRVKLTSSGRERVR